MRTSLLNLLQRRGQLYSMHRTKTVLRQQMRRRMLINNVPIRQQLFQLRWTVQHVPQCFVL